jgi:predicted nucleotidyltransferase
MLKHKDSIIDEFIEMISPLTGHIKEMYLFGSRCRNNWRPDSDYDVLIVLERKDRAVIDKLYDVVIDTLLATGKLISLKIFKIEEFNRLKSIPTPFMSIILKEGIKIG